MEIERPRHSIGWPLILIAAGIIFLLNNLGLLPGDAWEVLVKFWPLLLVIAGLDSLYRGDGLVGALFIAGIGIVFLLSNLGYLTFDVWGTIIRFWPILIIAVGLDIILGHRGRRSVWAILAGIILFLVLISGLLWFAGQNSPLATIGQVETVNYDVGSLQSANLTIQPVTGDLKIQSSPGNEQLVSGSIQLSRGEELTQDLSSSGNQGMLEIKSSGFVFIPSFRKDANWSLEVTDAIPLDLNVTLPLGRTEVDLTDLNLTGLNVTTVMGKTEVTLPQSGSFAGRVECVMGTIVIKVPQGTAVRIHTSSGITSTQIPVGFERIGDSISSPAVANASDVIDLEISQVMGRLEIQNR